MADREIFFKLPEIQALALHRLAQQQDVSVGQIVRNAIAHEIRRQTRAGANPNQADETLLAPLRSLLARPLADAQNWHDLQQRLAELGYVLREAGGGLALHHGESGERLCKASELGYSYATLMRRFDAPFPGHSHTHMARRVLGQPPGGDDDVELIEEL